MKIKYAIMGAVALLIAACSNEQRWSVSGNITGADGELLVLEGSRNGVWSVIDSARLDSKGGYKFKAAAAGYPDIYRVTVNGKSAYFPIDSVNDVTLSGDAATLASNYELGGSQSAEMLGNVNRIINAKIAEVGSAAVTDSILKRELSGMILGDQSGIISYYIVNKEIGGKRLFNPADKKDLRVIGAVVNAFTTYRPEDPRTRYMQEEFLHYRRASQPKNTVAAQEILFPDIELMDRAGQRTALSSLVGKGRPVIVNFTAYSTDFSPAVNLALANVYNAGGVNIYQISVDGDEVSWREAARNLPWTTVLNTPRDGNQALASYNVGSVPATFIIDRDGKLVERVDDLSTLDTIMKKYR